MRLVHAIDEAATEFGLGQETGIPLPGEQVGFVPTKEKNKARRVALLASRTNMMLSIPMLFFMAGGMTHKAAFGL